MSNTALENQTIEEFLYQNEQKTLLRFSTAGSVDDGKSTLIGRLLHDSKNIFEDTLAAIKETSKKSSDHSKEKIDLALITDGLKAEREQKITIDVAYRYFSTPRRNFILADTPGHIQYTRNMATGASTSNAAIVLIDAKKGVITQTKRHSFILSLLGVNHILVAVNKMDLVDYSQEVFKTIREDYLNFARKLTIPELHFIPISALVGDNVVNVSKQMNWYQGQTVLNYLENVYIGGDRNLIDFRFPVQYVIRPDQKFRGFSGQVISGSVNPGDEVIALPSLKKSKVKTISTFDGNMEEAFAPMSVAITLEDEIDISRGDMIVHPNNIPNIINEFDAMLVWMSEQPLKLEHPYIIKHTSNTSKVRIEEVRYNVDVDTLSRKKDTSLNLNEIARVKIKSNKALYLDSYRRNRCGGSFILVDTITNNTVAAGLVLDLHTESDLIKPDQTSESIAQLRNIRREIGQVTRDERENMLNQKAQTIWLTGLSGSGKSTIAKYCEKELFDQGKLAYLLDGDNIRFGLNKDLSFSKTDRQENIRRIAEVSRLLNDAGIIVITAFISPFESDREVAKNIIGEDNFMEVFIDTPIDVCESRDIKGLYKKARSGEIDEFTGVTSPYEKPSSPDVVVNTDDITNKECVATILDKLKN